MEKPDFYTTPAGILSDDDAATIEANFDTAPDTGKPYLAAKLNEYKVFRAHFPKPMNDYETEMRAADFRTLHSLANDWEGTVAAMPEERRQALEFADVPDPTPYRQQTWNQAFLDHFTKEETLSPEDYAARRAAFANANFDGVGADDDAMFYTAAKAKLDGQVAENELVGELGNAAVKAAMAGKPFRPALASWEAQAKAKPGFNAARLDYYNQAGQEAYEEALKRQAAYGDTVQELLGVMRRRTGVEGQEESDLNLTEIEALADKFVSQGYTREQRDWILQSAAVQAEEIGIDAKGFFKQFGESFVRGGEGVLIGAAYGAGRAAMQGAQKFLYKEGEAMMDAPLGLGDGAGQALIGMGNRLEGKIARVDMAEALRRFGDEEIDPIRTHFKGWMGKVESGVYGIGSTLPSLLSASGAGLVMQALSMGNDTYMELREKYPDMTEEEAQGIALPAGAIMGALDRVEAMIALGGFNKGTMGRAFREWVEHSYLKSMGTAAVGEFVTETAQNFVPLAMQELQAKFSEDIPDLEFWEEAKTLLAQSPETFIAVLPLAALGGGMGVYADKKSARALLTSPDGMRLAGIAPEKIDLITAMAKEGQVDQAIGALREAWTTRDKSVTMAESVAGVAQEYRAEAERRVAAAAEAGVTIKRVAGGWQVRDGDGNETTHAEFPAAEAELYRAAGQSAAQIDETILASMASYAQSAPEGESFTFTDRGKTAAEDYLKAKAEGKDDLAQGILNRIEIERQRSGSGPDTDFYILGENETIVDLKGQVVEMANRLFRGAGVETLIEEKSEGVVKRWVGRGATSIDKVAQALRAVSAATGGQYLHGYVEGGDATANAQAVIEGYSKLAVEYATGRSAQGEARQQSGATRALGTQLSGQQRRTMARLREAERMGVGDKILRAARDTWDVFRASVDAAMRTAAAVETTAGIDEIRAMLEESVGLGPEAQLVRQVEQAVAEEAKAGAPDPGPLPAAVTAPPSGAPENLSQLTNVTMLPDGTWVAGPMTHSLKPVEEGPALEKHLADVGVPKAKRPAARKAMAATGMGRSRKSKRPGKPADIDAIEAERAKRRQAWIGMIRHPFTTTPEQRAAALAAIEQGPISSVIHEYLERKVPAFNVRGATVRSAEDARQLFLSIRSPYFETSKILLLDKRKKVIGSRIFTIGSLNEAIFGPRELLAAVMELMEDAGNQEPWGFIVSHNHPSGNPAPSQADIDVTARLKEVADMAGVQLLDHVITNGKDFFSFSSRGMLPPQKGYDTSDDRSMPSTADWEVVPRDFLPPGNMPSDLAGLAYNLATADPGHAHVIYLNMKLMVSAVERVPLNDEAAMIQTILRGVSREGAKSVALSLPQAYHAPDLGSYMISSPEGGRLKEMHDKLTGAMRKIGASLVDMMTFDANWNPHSWAQAGMVTTKGSLERQALAAGGKAPDVVPFESAPPGLDPDRPDLSFSMKAADKDYFAAVERGDMEAAQAMVDAAAKAAESNGGDAPHSVYVVFESSQVKSADPVTLDTGGNVIPLSQRFNQADPRISFAFRARHGAGVGFDRFSTDFIGEGAGAQVYGWGVYFTDTPEVARDYQRMAAATAGLMDVNGQTMTALEALELFPVQRERLRGWWNDWARDALAVHSNLDPAARAYRAKKAANQRLAFELEDMARKMRLPNWRQAQGFAYEAEIAADFEELLDFGKPAKAQGSIIADALHRLADQEFIAPIDQNRTGEEIYRDLSTILGGDRQASEALLRAGIKGSFHEATYHGLRGVEGPSGGLPKNFVVFDDSLITITRREHGDVSWSLRAVDQEITDVLWRKKAAAIHAGNFEGGKVRQLAHKFRRMLEANGWKPVDLRNKSLDPERLVEEASERLVIVLERAREAFPEFVSWYDKRLRQAIGIMQDLDPALNDPDHLFVFKAALAITSNGNAVGPQTEFAYQVYQHWAAGNALGSYKGSMGERSKDIRKTLGLVDKLIATQGIKGAKAWLDNSGAKSTVRKAIMDAFGMTAKQANDLTAGELIDEVLPFSVIFGSKLGSFYNNLNGRFDTITMDRWFMRTVGRTLGTQLVKLSGAAVQAGKSRLAGALMIAREKHKNHPFVAIFRGMGRDYDRIAKASNIWTSKESNRETIAEIPELDELRLAANAWYKIGDGMELDDAPKSGYQRRLIRQASLRALAKFKAKTGVEYTPAEFQAVLWYYEKAVHESHGSRQKEPSPDYAAGANTLYTKLKGKPSKKFKESEAMTPPYARKDWDPAKANPAPSRAPELKTYSMAPVRMKGVQRGYLSPDSDEIGPVGEWWQINLPETYWHGSDMLLPVGTTQTEAMKAALDKYEALPEAKASLGPEAVERLTTFAISSADYIDRLADRFDNPQGAPAARVEMYLDARQRLQGLARSIRLNESLEDALTVAGLRKQGSVRRRQRIAELRAEGRTYREAQQQARREVDEWLADAIATMPIRKQDAEPRLIYRAMLALEQMLAAFPPEVRRQVGGFIGIARETTQKGRANFLLDRANRAMEATEEFLRRELRQQIADLFERSHPTGGTGERRQGKLGAWRHRWFARAEEYALTDPAGIAAAIARWEKVITDAQAGDVPDDVMDELTIRWGVEIVIDQATALDMAAEELALAETVGGALWGPAYPGENATEAEWAAYRAAQRQTMPAADLDVAWNTLHDAYESSRLDWLAELARRREDANDFRDTTLLPALGYSRANLPDPGTILEGGSPNAANRGAAAVREQLSFEQTVADIFGDDQGIRDWADNWERAAAVAERLALDGRTYDLRQALHQILATQSITELHRRLAALALPEDLGLPKLQRASQLELASLVMRYNEEGSQEWMDENGYDAAWQQAAIAKLKPETVAIMGWVGRQYEADYNRINSVYSREKGVDLPKVAGYAGMRQSERGSELQQMAVDGNVMEGGLSSGFTKTRVRKPAGPPKVENILAQYLRHAHQVEHYRAWATPMREMRQRLGHRETMMAIEARRGRRARGQVNDWLNIFDQGGVRQAGIQSAVGAWLRRMLSTQSEAALAFNLGTRLKQMPAAVQALADIRLGQFLRSAARVSTGQAAASPLDMLTNGALDTRRDDWRSNATALQIQLQREGRQSKLRNIYRQSLFWAFDNLAAIDAAFTSFGAAVAYDAAYREASALPEADRRRAALRRAQQVVSRTAQPNRAGTKSLWENQANVYARLLFRFQSANRQVLANEVYALKHWRKDPERAARILLMAHIIIPAMVQSLANVLKHAFTDKEAEEIWEIEDYLLAFAMGPISGLILFGPIIEGVLAKFKGFAPRVATVPLADMLDRATREWANGKTEADDFKAAVLLASMAIGGDASIANAVDQVWRQALGAKKSLDEFLSD